MARALGIDPGTKSFDLVLVDGERVVWEESIETSDIARDPMKLVEGIEEAGDYDLIAGPSGYGTPIVCNEDIVDPRTFALEILLLTPSSDVEEGVKKSDPGMMVYKALADVVEALWRTRRRVCYIPSVILLPTIPRYRKINKLDMGTADKMAIAVLGVYDQARRLGIDYSKTSFILVEMGYGYNAVIGVKEGRIVDGLGGTLTPTGFLTIGPIDAELVVAGRNWSRLDVFHGGASDICSTYSVEEFLEKKDKDSICSDAYESMMESIVKNVHAISYSVKKPREIIISGRLTRYKEVREDLTSRLSEIAPVARIKGLPGAKISKEAAQGYAVVGEGIAGGFFKKLVEHMKILEARGTTMDYAYHPRLRGARQRVYRAYSTSVKKEVLVKIGVRV